MDLKIIFVIAASYIFFERFFVNRKIDPLETLIGLLATIFLVNRLVVSADFIEGGVSMTFVYLAKSLVLVLLGFSKVQSFRYYIMVSSILFFLSYLYFFVSSLP